MLTLLKDPTMNIARLGTAAAALAGVLVLSGCVVAPADGYYYGGDAYSTVSSPGYSYGYGYPAYGSSLVIESSPTYVYGGGRPYYRPGGGGHYRPNYGGNYRPSHQGNRPSYVSPGAGSQLGRPSGGNSNSGSYRPSRPSGGGGGRVPGYQEVKPPQWQR